MTNTVHVTPEVIGLVEVTDSRGAIVVEVPAGLVSIVTAGPQGPQGLPGQAGPEGTGGSGGGSTYVHDQVLPSSVWLIEHTLSKFPSVTCMDSAGDEIEGILSYDSLDRVTMTFGAATGGKAYLN